MEQRRWARVDVGAWLKTLGLEEHAEAFAENGVDEALLSELTNEDLKDLGVARLADRKRLLKEIAKLSETAAPALINRIVEPTLPKSERRQLTVMFCDLVGSTELSTRLDPEDYRDLIRRYQDACAGAIARYHGFIARFMGDGVLAYFGYPRARENAVERAIRAGLAVVAAVSAQKVEKAPLQTRVGIATGQVVVGDLVGEGSSEEWMVSGETPNLAARLQGLADPDTVVIADATQQLAGELFAFEALGERAIKGMAAPTTVWRVLGEGRAETRFEARQRAGLTDFVGRENEIALLLGRWEVAKENEGQVVLLSGEAGIGKSRVIEALRERIRQERYSCLRYQCSPLHGESAFFPIIAQLQQAAGFRADDLGAVRLDKLESYLARSVDDVQSLTRFLASLLDLPGEERYGPIDLPPPQVKARTLDALTTHVLAMARRSPVVLIVEDAHWIDPSSWELLEQVVSRIVDAPVLLLISHRPDFNADWARFAHVTSLTLSRLSRSQGIEMVHAARGLELSEGVIRQILERADGVPLFLEELTHAVIESGNLLENASIPETLQDLLMERLDRLEEAKDIAQVGAVIGREFSHSLLASVVLKTEEELSPLLGRLVDSGLVYCRGSLPEIDYTFKHALVQEAAYDGLLKSRRKQLHARIASVFEQRFPERVETEPELLAHHHTEAGNVEKAIGYWQRAGERAIRSSANQEAIVQLSKGLAQIQSLPDTPERARWELACQISMGGAFIAARGYGAPDTAKAYIRARELCDQLGATKLLFPVLYGQWVHHAVRAEHRKAQRVADQFLELAESQQDAAPLLVAHRCIGLSHLYRGEPAMAHPHLEQTLSLYDIEAHSSLAYSYGQDPRASTQGWMSWVLWHQGYPDQALKSAKVGLENARALKHMHTIANTLGYSLTMIHQFCGDVSAADEDAGALVALAEEQGFVMWRALGTVIQGWAMVERGETEAGMSRIRDGIFRSQDTGAQFLQPHSLTLLAEALARRRQWQDALAVLGEARDFGISTGGRWWEAEVYRLEGEILSSMQSTARAEIAYLEARRSPRSSGAGLQLVRRGSRHARCKER
jgi:class 3 adenylate cyclase/predicted ATPase